MRRREEKEGGAQLGDSSHSFLQVRLFGGRVIKEKIDEVLLQRGG